MAVLAAGGLCSKKNGTVEDSARALCHQARQTASPRRKNLTHPIPFTPNSRARLIARVGLTSLPLLIHLSDVAVMAPQRYEPVRPTSRSSEITLEGMLTDLKPSCLQVSSVDRDNEPGVQNDQDFHSIPSSPPPSFRSRASSPTSRHLLASEDPLVSEADRTLADTFDDGSASDAESNDGGDDRQRLMRGNTVPPIEGQTTTTSDGSRPVQIQRTLTQFPSVTPVAPGRARGMPYSTFTSSNDGVFANLSAKPERGEKQEEEKPPVRPPSLLSDRS